MIRDRDALLAAILAAPDDDAPRLVFADWCDENGEPARASFIRLQIELIRSRQKQTPVERQKLKQQERRLFSRLDFGLPTRWDWGVYLKHTSDPHRDKHVVVRRGFVEFVACPAADWLAHGDAMLAAQPVMNVRLTTLPEMRHHSGDAVPNPSPVEVLVYLKGRWPRIKFELPTSRPEPVLV